MTHRILLHACCGPCSLEPVRVLRSEGVEPVVFYANSNIHPADEYAHRLDTLRAWAVEEGLEVVEGVYNPEAWEATAGRVGDAAEAAFGVIVNEEGDRAEGDEPTEARAAREARCRACYRLRFEEAARYAREHGFDALGTTLSVSPYQYTAIIREELERACEREGIRARFEDYRPFYNEATRRSREGGMYRQNYCGCRFSDAEADAERELRRAERRAVREAEAAAHANERAAEEAERARKRAEKQAYAAKQAKKRAALKALRERR
ncbi:epoxyqueuosine reductase QueH [Adlercreutzia caecimuris]|uniref:epoxyqueuosine reductase QueH n=1 Tax=Adlercreutzia caecimuris TaxID=671266 RepID=UPI001C3D19AC|nr:epoxyqueuosine reductase QueH [Adlercreutzia caecimuris]MCR2037281.1 epoxyqueuosine reductase QueH [Adlercreutzia caecimuris]